MTVKESIRWIVRRLTRWAWLDLLWAASRVEWKYGRDGIWRPIPWDEWEDLRDELKDADALRAPHELKELP